MQPTGYDKGDILLFQRPQTRTDPEGGVTSYTYGLAGRLASLTDPVGNTTSYAYDHAGRLITRTDPLAHTTSKVYDAAGRISGMTDRNGRQTAYVYDNAGRRTQERWLDGGGIPIRTISYAYDNADRLTSASDPDSAYSYAYDANSRVTQVDNLGTPGVPNLVLTSAYNVSGDRTNLADNLGGATQWDYIWPGVVDTISTSAGSIGFTYDGALRLKGLQRPSPPGSSGR